MKHLYILFFILFIGLLGSSAAKAQEQTLTWEWANVVCADMLNCQTGCSSCNQPSGSSDDLYGTGAAWIGLSTCPHPVVTGNNAVLSTGWSPGPDPMKVVLLSGIMSGPMNMDSLIVRHSSFYDGPTWLRISLKHDLSKPATMVYEGPISSEFTILSLSDLGLLPIPEGGSGAGFQLQFQAYGSAEGAWALDQVRVVVSPSAPDISTGVTELSGKPFGIPTPMYDVLGRPAGKNTVLGISRDGKRRIVIE